MKIGHVALYTRDLERTKRFYEEFFYATANEKYHNPKTSLSTYFLSFQDGVKLEIMTREDIHDKSSRLFQVGYVHIAFTLETNEEVDALTKKLEMEGYEVSSRPRTTGDGYYESCILDWEGNTIELVAK